MNAKLFKRTLTKLTITAAVVWGGVYAGATQTTSKSAPGQNLTAFDQSRGTDRDVEATRLIRQKLVEDKTLSTKAKNINIVTLGGDVSLKGSVDTPQELTKIENHIRAVSVNANINQAQVTVVHAR